MKKFNNMGGGFSKSKKSTGVPLVSNEYKYTLTIVPPSFDNLIEFELILIYSSVPLPTLMNFMSFDSPHSKEFDANFISMKDLGKYNYYVQRLMGYEIENEAHPKEGKMWVPYINDNKMDWNEICEDQLYVKPADLIEWKFQKHTEFLRSPTKPT